MKSIKSFRNVIRPLPDEVLSSWLYRGFKAGDTRLSITMAKLIDSNIADPDAGERDKAFDAINKELGLTKVVLDTLTPSPPSWIPPPTYRINYCASCILDDIKNGRHPAYRKSWMHRWAVGCPIHLTELSALEEPVKNTIETINLGATSVFFEDIRFAEYTPRDMLRFRYYAPAPGYFLLALGFQQWILRNSKNNFIEIPDHRAVYVSQLLEFLDALSISMMRPCDDSESTISLAYSHLPPKKWPRDGYRVWSGESLPANDIALYPPLIKSGLLAMVGLYLNVPACCGVLNILKKRGFHTNLYCPSLFPNDNRELQSRVIDSLREKRNPLVEIAIKWQKDCSANRVG